MGACARAGRARIVRQRGRKARQASFSRRAKTGSVTYRRASGSPSERRAGASARPIGRRRRSGAGPAGAGPAGAGPDRHPSGRPGVTGPRGAPVPGVGRVEAGAHPPLARRGGPYPPRGCRASAPASAALPCCGGRGRGPRRAGNSSSTHVARTLLISSGVGSRRPWREHWLENVVRPQRASAAPIRIGSDTGSERGGIRPRIGAEHGGTGDQDKHDRFTPGGAGPRGCPARCGAGAFGARKA